MTTPAIGPLPLEWHVELKNMIQSDPESVRPPAAAGKFYPHRETELRGLLQHLLAAPTLSPGASPKAVICPHAGYIFSGPIAASAYAQLAPQASLIRRVILVGPSHFVGFQGLALSGAGAFHTPLGPVPLDLETAQNLRKLPHVQTLDEAHDLEHSLEVQLPFLQMILPEFNILPLLVGEASPDLVSHALDLLWDGPQTRIVVSSDLSHYHDSDTARRLDEQTANAIEGLHIDALHSQSACGYLPICGLLKNAQRRNLRVRRLDLRNSGDTAGPPDRVVGYGAFGFYE